MRRILLTALLVPVAFGQGPSDPPPIIELVRKPGVAAAPVRPYGEARATVNVIAMSAVTGVPETWFVEAHYSFGSIEDLDKGLTAVAALRPPASTDAMQDDVLAPSRTILATYQPNWSYRPDQAIRMFPRARYFHVTIYQIRSGTEEEFGELVKLRRASYDSINLDRPDLAYEVLSGAPSGTYIFLSPVVSLKAMDGGVANTPVYAEGIVEARAKARSKTAPQNEIGREHLLFRVEPRLSYLTDDFVSADPDFWRGKQR
jgi:hypothetical protein